MTPEQFEQFLKRQDEAIKDGIEFHVNGKTKAMMSRLDEYIKEDIAWKKDDAEWKAEVKPYIETVKEFKGFTTVGTSVLKGILLIGSVTTAIYGIIKFLRN